MKIGKTISASALVGLLIVLGAPLLERPGEDAGTPRHIGNGPPGIDRSS